MKLTQANIKANITDFHKDSFSGHTRADGMVFGRSFSAERHDGKWEAVIVMDDGEYSLTGVHRTIEGALQQTLRTL